MRPGPVMPPRLQPLPLASDCITKRSKNHKLHKKHSPKLLCMHAQEWLWCETWCGNATKAAAKTIDLCNNPLTKEPKLEGARRIVAEWPALDAEQRSFTLQARHD